MFTRKTTAAILSILLVLTAVFAFSSCSSSKTLKVGIISNTNAPMEYKDADGKTIIGFEVDVAKELATRMGYTNGVKFIVNDKATLFDNLETGKYNVVISSVVKTTELNTAHSITNAYVVNKNVLITTKANPTQITTPVMLATNKVGVLTGTSAATAIQALVDGKTMTSPDLMIPYTSAATMFADLELGTIEAVMTDIFTGKDYMKRNPDKFTQTWQDYKVEQFVAVFAKPDAVALRDKANTIIAQMQTDGTMTTISKNWFGEDITKITN